MKAFKIKKRDTRTHVFLAKAIGSFKKPSIPLYFFKKVHKIIKIGSRCFKVNMLNKKHR